LDLEDTEEVIGEDIHLDLEEDIEEVIGEDIHLDLEDTEEVIGEDIHLDLEDIEEVIGEDIHLDLEEDIEDHTGEDTESTESTLLNQSSIYYTRNINC